jgi:hypothetical protein
MKVTIKYGPEDVSVCDDRGSVPGAWVELRYDDGTEVSDEIIPPEGDHPDCWLGGLSGYHDEIGSELEYIALEGAAGRSGTIDVELS